MERGWTQKQLAEAASLRPNTLTNIIKHGRDTDTATLSRIAGAFGVELGDLFITREQSQILRAYGENRIERVKEAVLSELSGTVTRLVREDYERLLKKPGPQQPLRKPSRRRASSHR